MNKLGFVLHGLPKGIWRPETVWNSVMSMYKKIGVVSPDSINLIGFTIQGERPIEKSYFRRDGFKKAPLSGKDVDIWSYSTHKGTKNKFTENNIVRIKLSQSGCYCEVELKRGKHDFYEDLIIFITELVLAQITVHYGYTYETNPMDMYPLGLTEKSLAKVLRMLWLSDYYEMTPLYETKYPKDPIHHWGWFLKFKARKIAINDNEKVADLQGVFRDVFQENVLGTQHLETNVSGAKLKEKIEISKNWGKLKDLGEGLMLWSLSKEEIPLVRKEMRQNNLLVAYREST